MSNISSSELANSIISYEVECEISLFHLSESSSVSSLGSLKSSIGSLDELCFVHTSGDIINSNTCVLTLSILYRSSHQRLASILEVVRSIGDEWKSTHYLRLRLGSINDLPLITSNQRRGKDEAHAIAWRNHKFHINTVSKLGYTYRLVTKCTSYHTIRNAINCVAYSLARTSSNGSSSDCTLCDCTRVCEGVTYIRFVVVTSSLVVSVCLPQCASPTLSSLLPFV